MNFNVGDHIVCKYDGRKGRIYSICYQANTIFTKKKSISICIMNNQSKPSEEYYDDEIEIDKEYYRNEKLKSIGI